MLVKSLKLLFLKPYSAKKKLSSQCRFIFNSTWQKVTSILRFWIIVIPETEKLCLEPTVCWAELRTGDAEPLLGELNVRSGNKKKYGQLFLANKTSKRLCRTY